MAVSQDTEITLGTGKIVTLFFALVGVCALFFGLGYSMGRSSQGESALATQLGTKPDAKSAGVKPATSKGVQDLTFYQAVKQNEGEAQPQATGDTQNAPTAASDNRPSDQGSQAQVTGVLPSNAYVVQVAAVSKKEDADALVSALKNKGYAVYAGINAPYDNLFHIQIGPYTDLKQAEDVRAKLVADGYNPIVKK